MTCMNSAAQLIAFCDTFVLHGYHASSVSFTREPAAGKWSLNILFSDFLSFGTPDAELSEVPEFGEDSVPGGYFIPAVHRAGKVEGAPGVILSGWYRVPDYTLKLDWPSEAEEQAEAIIAELASKGEAIDWATFRRKDGYVRCLTKPGRWLVGVSARLHAESQKMEEAKKAAKARSSKKSK